MEYNPPNALFERLAPSHSEQHFILVIGDLELTKTSLSTYLLLSTWCTVCETKYRWMLSTYIYKEEKQNPPSSKLICLYNKVVWGLRFEKCYEMFW